MNETLIQGLIPKFFQSYDAKAKDSIWQQQSITFRDFWSTRVMASGATALLDEESDRIIRILDRNGKGNTKDSEAVAKAMVAQGAWRRMLRGFQSDRKLAQLVDSILKEENPELKASLIDDLYRVNAKQKNRLTGQSGNTINAFLAAYDPLKNLSIISLKDRKAVMDYLKIPLPFDWDTAAIGKRIIESNSLLRERLQAIGIKGSARTQSRFWYLAPVRMLWKGQHTVKRTDKSINVTVPENTDSEESSKDEIRESLQIQAVLAKIGSSMGFQIWLPKSDRARILTKWKPNDGDLLDVLPLNYDDATLKTIEQIDVLWLKKRSIVRAFEVEHTTSVYSGLLRMADLLALQPNMNIKLHIVAPTSKRDKVFQEIRRPVFSLLEGRALSEICSYLSYDSITELREQKHLEHLSDHVLGEYEEPADETD